MKYDLLWHNITMPYPDNVIRDPGATRTLNQQNRNLLFYPLNYGTVQDAKVY
jgi:hypothetical protein